MYTPAHVCHYLMLTFASRVPLVHTIHQPFCLFIHPNNSIESPQSGVYPEIKRLPPPFKKFKKNGK